MNYKLINPNNKELSIIETILTNRGIPLEEIEHYLHPTEADIWSPTLLGNIDLGAKMLVSHIAKGDKVLIQVDGDCDGYTSAALLINYLYRLFPTFVLNNLSYRIHTGKQHGIILDTIPQDIKLVIAPDSASNDYEVHQALQERGCDVLVLDHHLADKISEHACIINNQLSAYPNKSLSGVGIVYKFCCYIDSVSGTDYAKDYLDLVALGVVADMVDLRDIETRYLVMSGLNQIRNLFFKGMVDKQSFQLKDGLTPFGIAFYIAPYVNATIRVGTQDEKLTLLESMLDHRGHELVPSTKRGCKGQMETLVEQACRNCTNIKNRQTKARDESLNFIEELIEEKNLLENKVLIIKLADNTKVDKSIRGLIANQLMGKYQRPVMVLTKTVKPEGVFWEGSGRGYEAATKSLKDFVHDSGMSEYEQGHDNALGISIPDDKITEFVKYANEALKDFDFTTSYEVDFIYNPDELNKEDILNNADMEFICGPGCSGLKENLIAIEGLKLRKDDVILMSPDKKPTLKINLPDGITAIKFGSSKEEFEKLHSDLGCVTINIVGRCSKNYWNGITTPQIKITDYEIVNSMKYYF